MSTSDLSGRTAFVTGAARGLGLATARRLASGGAAVVIADRLIEEGEAAAAALRGEGFDVRFLPLDVTNERDWETCIAETVAATGSLDVLVNNAGVEVTAFLSETGEQDFRRVFNVNVLGTSLGIKHALCTMRPGGSAGRGGVIVNISSAAATLSTPMSGVYAASKAAVERLTAVAAAEAGRLRYGVRVCCVRPGLVPTALSAASAQAALDAGLFPSAEALQAYVVDQTPLGRLGAPDEIADGVAFLASDAARFVTGVALPITGGLGG